ncbi:MAG TPA: hypothetical protein VI757_01795, partial [Bacteroidia bacterium]|nr:hypothetical protein [Bacteroidia bacterium]
MKLFTAFIFFLFAFVCDGQVMFQKTYGRDSADYATSLIKTYDEGYLLAGVSTDYDRSNVYILLVKTNGNGDTLWTKIYGDTLSDNGVRSVEQVNDGGFILSGLWINFISGNGGNHLIKIDANGNVQWSKTYSGATACELFHFQQTNDGGYISPGYVAYNFHACIFIIRTNNLGDTLWTRAFADSAGNNLYGGTLLPNADGSFVVTGNGISNRNVLAKIDSSGNVLWTKQYSGIHGIGVKHSNDGGYLISGGVIRPGFTDNDIALIKTDSSGNVQWARAYGTLDDELGGGMQTSDGGFILSGYYTYSGDTSNIFLARADNNGNLLWEKAYGDTGLDRLASVFQTSDNGYILYGPTSSFGNGAMDLYLIKTDSSGMSGCHEWPLFFAMNNINVTVSSGGITAINPVTNVGTGSLSASIPVVQQTTLCYTVGIEEMNAKENSVTLFPNPATHEIKVQSSKFK